MPKNIPANVRSRYGAQLAASQIKWRREPSLIALCYLSLLHPQLQHRTLYTHLGRHTHICSIKVKDKNMERNDACQFPTLPGIVWAPWSSSTRNWQKRSSGVHQRPCRRKPSQETGNPPADSEARSCFRTTGVGTWLPPCSSSNRPTRKDSQSIRVPIPQAQTFWI